MNDQERTKEELAEEIVYLRRRVSELELVKEALQGSESRFQALFENMGDAVAVYKAEQDGEDFVLINFNKAAEKIEQISRDEVLGKSVLKVFPGVKEFGLFDVFQRVWRTGRAEYYPVSEYKDNRIQGWRENFVYRLPSGEVVAVYSDETERKKVEEALRESAANLAEAQRVAKIGIWSFDIRTNKVAWSDELRRIFGIEEPDFDGPYESFVSLVHPDDQPRVLQTNLKTRTDGSPFDLEYRVITPEDQVKIIREVGHANRDDAGKVIRIFGTAQDITDRKKAEDELRESQLKYRALIEGAPVGIFQSTFDGRVLSLNPAYARMYGYASAEEAAREIDNVAERIYVEPERRKMLIDLALSTEGFVKAENQYRKKDGSLFWGQLYFRVIRDCDGEAKHLEGFVEDITERKLAENNLRESEKRYRRLHETMRDAFVQVDMSGRITDFNRAYQEMLGYSREELLRMTYVDLTPVKWHELEARIVSDEILPHAQSSVYEKEYIRKSGGVFPVELRTFLIADDAGHPTEMWAIVRDITQRKQAEEALLESDARYRMLFNDSRDAVYMTTRDGQLLEANQAYFDLFDYKREEIIGGDIRSTYVNLTDRDRFVQAIEARGFLKNYPVAFRKTDGKEMDCLLTAGIRRGEDGTILGYHGIIRDVTEQRILQKQLLQAQKMEAIGTLAGGIAHDFNNLLTVVMGFSELLLAEKEQDDPEYADLQKIFHAAENGAELVQRLLMFSRKSEPKPISMDLNKQIVQVEKLLRRTIPRMVDIHLDLSPDLPQMNADPSQVEQVLMNLAVNARDAMPDKGTLTVKTRAATLDKEYCLLHIDANPGEHVLLEISDTGHGMDEEIIQHIFEPFFTTKEIGRGTGLGLAMAYGIVTQHNGHITVHSEVGKGTTFRVYFLAIQGEVEADVETDGKMPAFGTETVLLVDDEDLVRELGARILTKGGYTVIQALNGREALDLFKKGHSQISLVILDLIMPEMGGTECLREFLKIDPQVRVLVASGYSADASVREVIQMGARGFATKPFRVNELLRDVRRVLDEG